MRRSWLGLPLLAAGLVALAACGAQGEGPAAAEGGAPAAEGGEPASGQGGVPEDLAALALYQGEDRESILQERAKANGEDEVVLYTSMSTDDSGALADGFTAKYGIPVNIYRADSHDVVQRLIAEGKSGAGKADVHINNNQAIEIAKREGLVLPFWTADVERFPADLKDPDDTWVAIYVNFITAAYNREKVKAEELPRTYEDLLKPEWKGRIAVDQGDYPWFATLVRKHFGEERGLAYFRQLAEQDIQIRKGHTLLVELLASGEIPFSATVYNYRVEREKTEKGAPIDWIPLEPVYAEPNGIELMKGAPHPNAALLFIGYVLSDEGQKIIRDRGRVPVHLDVPANPPTLNTGFQYVVEDAGAILDEFEKWNGLWEQIMLK